MSTSMVPEVLYRLAPQSTAMLVADVAALIVAVIVATKLATKRTRNPHKLPYPPGPKPSAIPFVGNIPDMPTKDGMCARP